MTTEDARKLFVAGLPDTITEDILRQLVEATGGTVVEVVIPRDRATGRPRGFGFVTLSTAEQADLARGSLDGSSQAGKTISVRPFQSEPPRRDPGSAGVPTPRPPASVAPSAQLVPPERTLYVGNLPYDCTQEELEELINGTGAGSVTRLSIPMDADGKRRGFGFATMDSADAARAAMEALKGAEIRGRRLVINLAYPKGERPPRADAPTPTPRTSTAARTPASPDRSYRYPSAGMASPEQPRKTFDERRRSGGRAATESEAGGRRRGRSDRDRDRKNDWANYDEDDDE